MSELEKDVADWIAVRHGSDLDAWKAALKLEYGCWCGPGNRCPEDKDAMDSCCHQHDTAYTSLSLNFDTMWSPSAIVKARDADQALYDCIKATPEPDDSAARAYREGLLTAFAARVRIAGWLVDLGGWLNDL